MQNLEFIIPENQMIAALKANNWFIGWDDKWIHPTRGNHDTGGIDTLEAFITLLKGKNIL